MALVRALGRVFRATGKALDGLGSSLQGSLAYKETLGASQAVMKVSGKTPVLGERVFVAPNANVMGEVKLGSGSSVWYGAVLRGDVNSITVGENSNIQDNVLVHVAKNNPQHQPIPTIIGSHVTIGHGATIHAATIEDTAFVGMGATVMDGAKVCSGAAVAAGALVCPGTVVPTGEIWAGSPAKFLRKLEESEAAFIRAAADNYCELSAVHAAENSKSFDEIELDKARREDRFLRDPDYDMQQGVERDPVTREVVRVAAST